MYLEGGGDSKELHARCREGFRRLLESCGYAGRLPRLVACGGRNQTFDDFKIALSNHQQGDYIAMLIDSETPVSDIDKTWDHVTAQDVWEKPDEADNEQILFMTTCMETWIVANRDSLRKYYGSCLQQTALPATFDLEKKDHLEIQVNLQHATRDCTNAYKKGKRSFEILGKLDPDALEVLPSFKRLRRILDQKL